MSVHEIIIIGAGGHGSELCSYIHESASAVEPVRFLGFIDDSKPKGMSERGLILGNLEDLRAFLACHSNDTYFYITAVGDNRIRRRLTERVEDLRANNLVPWSLRHPQALIGKEVEIGLGTCLAPKSVITTRIRIGKHCIVNVGASVSHDTIIGDFVNVNPGAVICGNVTIGHGCYIGAGATIIDKISVGPWTIIGAGAVVTRDLPERVTAVGVPARIIKRSEV